MNLPHRKRGPEDSQKRQHTKVNKQKHIVATARQMLLLSYCTAHESHKKDFLYFQQT